MLKRVIRFGRSHPILLAALIGAIAGGVNIILLEAGALMHATPGGVLPLLSSSSAVSSRIGHASTLQVALLLLIEVAGNLLGFALLFVIPVALIVAVRRLMRRRKTEALPSSTNSENES